MPTIHEIPKYLKPREKAIRYGISSLSDSELISILIRSGYVGENANELSCRLLNDNNGLEGLSKLSYEELCLFKGIKQSKALILNSIFEIHKRLSRYELDNAEINSDVLFEKYKILLKNDFQEHLIIVIVNNRNQITFEKCIYKGTDRKMSFSSKDILRILLNHKGKGFYLIHNHPSNKIEPSFNDIEITQRLIIESKNINFPLLDHLIIGDNNYVSIMKYLKI